MGYTDFLEMLVVEEGKERVERMSGDWRKQ